MAYDEDLADRIRGALSDVDEVREKRMFGGLAFLVGGHMALAVSGSGGLMLRCDPADAPAWLARDGVGRMVMNGRELDGWLLLDAAATGSDAALQEAVDVGVAFVATLPPK